MACLNFAAAVMFFTNFLVDMPLTIKLTNFFRENVLNSDKGKTRYDVPFMRHIASISPYGLSGGKND